MVKGLSFNISQEKTDVLFQILKCIEHKEYCWYTVLEQNEVWDGSYKNDFFKSYYYDKKTFFEHIKSEHHIVFLKLQGYHNLNNAFNLHTYKEFCESDCQLMLLIYDCEYVEIFAKDLVVIDAIYSNALNNGFLEIEYITEKNDERTKMDIK